MNTDACRFVGWSIVGLVLMTGCAGEPIGKIHGQVTLDGTPLTGASVVFHHPQTGVAVTGNLDERGAYRIRTGQHHGLPPGEYLVTLSPGIIGTGDPMLVGSAEAREPVEAPILPDVYQTVETTPLRATVGAGENPAYDFALDGDE